MKALPVCFLLIACFTLARAEKAELFHYDKQVVLDEMAALQKLEDHINTHQGITLAQLKEEGSPLVQQVNSNARISLDRPGDGPLGIPSFYWGLFLGVIGVFVVFYATGGDPDERNRAFLGALTLLGVVLVVGLGFIIVSNL